MKVEVGFDAECAEKGEPFLFSPEGKTGDVYNVAREELRTTSFWCTIDPSTIRK
jgi:hypothetical protein